MSIDVHVGAPASRGQITMAPAPTAPCQNRCMPKRDRSAKDQAYNQIRRRILSLELRPAQRIDDISLAAELDLSRTPVREALFQLSSDGLVQVNPRGGFAVQGLELLDIRELFEAHLVLAAAVARLLVSRVTDAGMAELQGISDEVDAATRRADPAQIAASNAELHLAEAKLARNTYFETLAGRIHNQGQRLAYLSFGGDGMADPDIAEHYQTACLDHAEMLEALRARDAKRAETIATRHVHLFRNRINTFLDSGVLDAVSVAALPLR